MINLVKRQNPKERCLRCGRRSISKDTKAEELFCSNCGFVLSEMLQEALSEMGKLKDKLALTDTVVEVALSIYRKALEKDLVNRRSAPIFTASAMYAACRNTAAQRNLKDMEITAGIKRKDIAKCYRLLVSEMDLKMPVTDSTQYVARIASRADLSEKIKRCAIKMLKEAQKHEFSAGKDPMGLAAGALYLSCIESDCNKTQRDIAKAANVSEITVRKRYMGLKNFMDLRR